MDENPQPGSDERSVVKFDERRGPSGSFDLVSGAIWCVLGVIAGSYVSLIGAAMMAYGVVLLVRGKTFKSWAIAVAACVIPLVVMGAFTGFDTMGEQCVECLAGLVVAWLVSRERVSVTNESLVIAAITVAYLVVDVFVPMLSGQDVVAIMASSIDTICEQYVAAGSVTQAQLPVLKEVMNLIWPFAYFALALFSVLVAHLGARLAANRVSGKQWTPFTLATFDVPTWGVAVLIVALVVCAVSFVTTSWNQLLLMIGVNLILDVRPLFALQGVAVVVWWLASKRVGCFGRTLVLFLAIDLELSFMVMSVVGLVDFWANFRHLPRGAKTGSGTTAE
jgi:hypothetical protein